MAAPTTPQKTTPTSPAALVVFLALAGLFGYLLGQSSWDKEERRVEDEDEDSED